MSSGKGRSYSDPSYGSKKVFSFARVSMGTRAAATEVTEAGCFTVIHPIRVTDWNIVCDATGNGGTSTWTLRKGSTAIGTLSFVTNPTAGTTVEGSLTETTLTAGDTLKLYSALSTAAPQPFITARVEYRETFEDGDN